MYVYILQLVSCLQVSSLKPCIHFSSVLCITHPSLPLVWSSNNIWWVHTTKQLTLKFSSASFYFLSFKIKFPTAACSWMPSVIFFLHVRDKVSHSYKTTGKITDLYIWIFMFSDLKKKYSEQNCLLLAMTAWHKHKFVGWRSCDII